MKILRKKLSLTFCEVSELDFVEFHETICTTVLRHHRRGKSFIVRKLSVKETELASWDLCSLFPPNTGKVKGGPLIQSLDCTWLVLKFPNEQKKNRFKFDAVTVIQKRVQQRMQQTRGREQAITKAERPNTGP